MKVHLDQKKIKRLSLPAKGTQIDYRDTVHSGLMLRVNFGGKKVWRMQCYLKRVKDGKKLSIPTTRELGIWPDMSLKEARIAAGMFDRSLVQAGGDSFKAVAENFIKRHVEHEKLRTQPEIQRCLNKYVFPTWADKAFRDIKRREVAELLDHIVDQHGARMADVVLSILRKMSNWYATRDSDYTSPIVPGMGRYDTDDHKRARILSDAEIRALFQIDCGSFGALCKVLLLTAQRLDKVATLQWDDIVDGVWTIKTEAREKGNAGSLRLPPLVLNIIESQPRLHGCPFVFPGRGGRSRIWFVGDKDRLDSKMNTLLGERPRWTLHDLRRTARSLMSRRETGVQRDVAERVLGHTIRGVEGVYDRHDYDDEKTEALAKLAALVEHVVEPPGANVIELDEHRAGVALLR